MTEKTRPTKPTKSTGRSGAFTEDERAAMKERAAEVKAAKRNDGNAKLEKAVLKKIAEMPQPDRDLAEGLHRIVKATTPELTSKLWYGMPAYVKDGKVICFFKPAEKFKARFATLGFDDEARLDDGAMWPTSFGITELGEAQEARIAELLIRAIS